MVSNRELPRTGNRLSSEASLNQPRRGARQPPGVGRQGVEPPHGHDKASLGPRSFEGDEGEGSPCVPLPRHSLGHHDNTRAERDHAAGGVQPAHPHARPHPPTRTRRAPGQVPAECPLTGKAHELAAQRLGERDPLATGERVPARHDEHEPILAEGHDLQPGKVGVTGRDPDFSLPFRDGPRHLRAWPFAQIDVHVRVRAQEGREGLGQMHGGCGRVGQQAHVPLQPARVLAQLAAHPLHLAGHQPRVVQQCPACWRRLHPTSAALQEGDARLRLHPLHPRAGGRQGETGASSARRDAPRLGHVEEQAQIGQVEVHRACSGRAAFVGG